MDRYGSRVLILAAVAGLIGGTASGVILRDELVNAKEADKRPRVIEAESFNLVDKDGAVRASFLLSPQGTASLVFNDKEGKSRMVLALPSDGRPSLLFFDKNSHMRMGIEMGLDGEPDIRLADKDGKGRLTVALDEGAPFVELHGQDGKSGVTLAEESDGTVGLRLLDRNEITRSGLFLLSDGEPRLSLFDKDGKRRAAFGAVDLEANLTGVVEKRPESSLVLFTKDESAIWKAL